MFLTCHPALTPESRAALTLRLVGGLSTEEIARGFLVKDTAVGQRISRAKRTLAEAGATLEMPTGAERADAAGRRDGRDLPGLQRGVRRHGRLRRGCAPTSASRRSGLARMLAALAPTDAEVHGLQALLELQASRFHARTTAFRGAGAARGPGPRSLGPPADPAGTGRALARAEGTGQPVGVYTVQAAIAACHARARRASEDTDWTRIATLYDLLSSAGDNPAVEVNRAVAHGRAFGPDAGLAVLDAVADVAGSPYLGHQWHAVRGDLLSRAGRTSEAAEEFRTSASLTHNDAERSLLLRRAESG